MITSACGSGDIAAVAAIQGAFNILASGLVDQANAQGSPCHPAFVPRLEVQKDVACKATGNCDATQSYSDTAKGAKDSNTNPEFCYRYIIRNTGTAVLNINTVTDSEAGSVTAPGGLTPGQAYTNFFGPRTLTATTVNTLTASGEETSTDPVLCGRTPISTNDTATAQVLASVIDCRVEFRRGSTVLTGNVCPADTCSPDVGVTQGGGTIDVVVVVSNRSSNAQSITNCTINVNSGTIIKAVPGSLAPGASSSVIVTNLPDEFRCDLYSATVTCDGVETGNCPPIDTTCQARIQVCGTPNVNIFKMVKCLDEECPGDDSVGLIGLGGVSCSMNLNDYHKAATGAVNAAFCYSITITNNGQLVLTNVTVSDNVLSNIFGNPLPSFPTTLNVGQSVTRFFGPVNYPGAGSSSPTNIPNTATVRGESAGGNVNASDDARVRLLPVGISCEKTVNGVAGGTFNIPFGTTTNLVFRVTVRNTGSVDLENIKVIDAGANICGQTTNTIAFLASGANTNIVVCMIDNVPCPPQGTVITNIVRVSGQVAADDICRLDPNCDIISTSSACTNTVTIDCTPPGICRVTGGGRQDLPRTCPRTDPDTGRAIRYVTHGGQVGAPFGEETECTLNEPCIRGEWQHVRHMKGGLRGNFHARSNGRVHNFDSLRCVCLACFPDRIVTNIQTISSGVCTNFDFVYNSAASTDPGKKFDLCNKDDGPPRGECGPQPRPAPANKICFSGVGDYTMNKGKRTPRSVVFRVDIEDRSEPGGFHPKGSTPPPDRYRIRMWFISGPRDTGYNALLRCGVACKDPLTEVVDARVSYPSGANRPPDIDDGGDLDRGNHQIHPQIKPCD